MDPGKSVSEWTIPFTPHTRSLSMDNIQSYSPASGAFTPAPTAPGRHFGPLSENTPIRFMETPAPFSVSLPRTSTKRPRVISQANRDEQKMKDVLDAITGVKWTLGEFLHRLFRRNEQEVGPRRSQHSQMVSKFLTGGCDYSTSDILTSWMTSPYGSLPADSLLAADIAARSHFICSPNCWGTSCPRGRESGASQQRFACFRANHAEGILCVTNMMKAFSESQTRPVFTRYLGTERRQHQAMDMDPNTPPNTPQRARIAAQSQEGDNRVLDSPQCHRPPRLSQPLPRGAAQPPQGDVFGGGPAHAIQRINVCYPFRRPTFTWRELRTITVASFPTRNEI
ncbi:hypothetical protein B0H10DRAFT_1949369 [Mycena sp. CBHHK59/15]|nr:hypothetical protein B0H10DRAFT_1949369 [Mycena sp. CBHHK59/15]